MMPDQEPTAASPIIQAVSRQLAGGAELIDAQAVRIMELELEVARLRELVPFPPVATL